MKIVQDTVTGWIAVFSKVIILFFLLPFILRHIGLEAFGLWSLVLSIIGFAELLDVGLANAVVKYTSKTAATTDLKERSFILSTIFFSYLFLSIGGAITLVLLSPYLTVWFSLPRDYTPLFYKLLFLIGTRTFLTLPFSLYRGVLFGEGYISTINLISSLGNILNGLFSFALLISGYNALSLALASLFSGVIEFGCYFLYGRHYAHIHWSQAHFSKTYPKIASFTISQFANNIGSIVLNNADVLIAKLFLSLTDVASYAIASRLVAYCYVALKQFTNALTPTIVRHDTLLQKESLKQLYLFGTRYAFFLGLALFLGALFFAKPLIYLWLGEAGNGSILPLQLLLLSLLFRTVYFLAADILQMTGYHLQLLGYLTIENIVHIGVAALCAAKFGLIGIPFGSLASTFCGFFLDFRKVCQIYQLSLQRVLKACLIGL